MTKPAKPRWGRFAAIALVCAIGMFVFLQMTGGDVTKQEVEQALMDNVQVPAQADFYRQISADFPTEYQGFLADFAAAANADGGMSQQQGFALGGQFTEKLRRDNAPYLLTAPLDDIRAMNAATLALFTSLRDDPALCGQFAIGGGAGLSMDQAMSLDMDLVTKVSAAGFKTMAAGRDTPVVHPAATDADILQAVSMWQVRPDVSGDMMRALSSGDPAHPAQCEANISFQRFVMESTDPVVQRAMIRMVMLANGI